MLFLVLLCKIDAFIVAISFAKNSELNKSMDLCHAVVIRIQCDSFFDESSSIVIENKQSLRFFDS